MSKTPAVIKTISEMREYTSRHSGKTIGFVPTMGYLHEGHTSLVARSVAENQITVVSIFVNPTQFGLNEDLDKYPRDLDRDLSLLSQYEVDVVFYPDHQAMYPENFKTFVEVDKLSNRYCGKSRPGHFRGVLTIVNKLVNIVTPHFMYMGEKDFQQIFILETMLKDLNMTTKIIRCPIIRETDGLAMSSRNTYLNKTERNNAKCLYFSLILAKELYLDGFNNVNFIKSQMTSLIYDNGGVTDYIAFVNDKTFTEESSISDDTRILLAVKIGNTRLIDNMKIGEK